MRKQARGIVPAATGEDRKNGWTVDYGFLNECKWQLFITQATPMSWDDLQDVLIVLRDMGVVDIRGRRRRERGRNVDKFERRRHAGRKIP